MSAQPVPQGSRAPWYKNTAQTYAGIMLWFAFWQAIPVGSGGPGGVLAAGIMPALLGIVLAALVCHFLFYLVPALLGMRTGLPLYVVGTSTYGVKGGLFMPGLLMGLLQFGWLAFNCFFVSVMLCQAFKIGLDAEGSKVLVPGPIHGIIAAVWGISAAFVGLKGIQYVARVASFLPLICLVLLIAMFFATIGGLGDFDKQKMIDASAAAEKAAADADGDKDAEAKPAEEKKDPLSGVSVIIWLAAAIAGFFATAGAAGTDIASNNRDDKDVQLGGLTGVALATIVSCGLAVLVIAGAYGGGMISAANMGNFNPIELMGDILGEGSVRPITVLLAISSFPPACFSAFIAANSFRTTMPKVNPFVSVGIGTAVGIVLAVTGIIGDAPGFFGLIGATFGPVCGAMAADFLLSGKKWAGPRASFNLAGWISWIVGAVVGLAGDVIPGMAGVVPCPPLAALATGFVLYVILAKAGMESEKLEMSAADSEPAAE